MISLSVELQQHQQDAVIVIAPNPSPPHSAASCSQWKLQDNHSNLSSQVHGGGKKGGKNGAWQGERSVVGGKSDSVYAW